jgi:hypothetical protein
MNFEFLFVKDGCWTSGPEAYVCALSSGGYEKPDPRSGRFLLTHESCSESECHKHIDALIRDLQKLKMEASRKFRIKKQIPLGFLLRAFAFLR